MLLQCLDCTTRFAVGLDRCPHCGSQNYQEAGMAKANAVTGSTYYLPEGAAVPDDLPAGVRLVGPGAPAEDLRDPGGPEGEDQAGAEPESADGYDTWTNDELRDELQTRSLATSGNKPDLVQRLRDDDRDERP